jgi:hypothetical protein
MDLLQKGLLLGTLILGVVACGGSGATSDGGLKDGSRGETISFVDSWAPVDLLPPDRFVDPNDTDGDGLANDIERQLGTDPSLADTDNDGVDDATEVGDPSAPTDSDSDGKIDALEPDNFDSDMDEVPDQQDSVDTDGMCGEVKRLLINETLDTNTTLDADCSPYKVLGTLKMINGAELTAMAGVTITFGPTAVLQIGDSTSSGGLVLAGSSEGFQTFPVTLTADSQSPSPGYWRGVVVVQGAGISFNWATVSWAGGNTGSSDPKASVLVKSANAVSILNSTFENGQGYGLHAAFSVSPSQLFQGFKENTFKDLDHALALHITHLAEITSEQANDFGTEGAGGEIHVHGGELDQAATWDNPGVPFIFGVLGVFGEETITIGAELKMNPGLKLVFLPNSVFMVNDSGQLEASGETGSPITFTTASGNAGSWQGLLMMSGLSTLSDVLAMGAGHPTSLPSDAAIYVDRDSFVFASQVAIANSSGKGAYFYMQAPGCSMLPTTGFTFSNVAGCTIYCQDDDQPGICLTP